MSSSESEQKSSSEVEEMDEKPVKSAQEKKNKRKRDIKKKNSGGAAAPAPQQKKAKVESPKTPAIAPKDSSDESDSDGSEEAPAANVPEGTILDLGRDCHARINNFKGKIYLDFRGYYTLKGSNEMKPGNKGISFTPEQWALLKKNIPVLDKALQKATKR